MTGLVRSVSSIPHFPHEAEASTGAPRGGDTEPTRFAAISDPILRGAFMSAHVAWARRRAPHLLREWETT